MKKLLLLALAMSTSSAVFSTEYIVKFKKGSMEPFMSQKSLDLDIKDIGVTFGEFGLLKSDDKSTLSSLMEDSRIEYVEENQTWTIDPIISGEALSEVPSDNMYSQQWGLNNTGKNSGSFTAKAGEDINAEDAWPITKGHEKLRIAVIDTGIDWKHPDLKENMWVNEAEKNGKEGVDDDGNGFIDDIHGYDFANDDGDPTDGHGHGTHCAGVIGASHNGKGVAGVLDKVNLIGIKFLTDRGSGTTVNAIKSIEYAIKVKAHVMSNSWGGGGFSQALKDAIVAAKEKGIIFVAAAGNSRSNNDSRATYPANYDVSNVISVGSMDSDGKKSSFSNYGAKTVHVFAPGRDILSTVTNGKYRKMSGTSMATPFVSGIVGMALAADGPTDKNKGTMRKRMVLTSKKTDLLNQYSVSAGRVDAYRALEKITK